MQSKYIIITPAKNEEKFIERTILSVINQTILPEKWIIVDDGSIDSTSEIVKKYLDKYPFIKLVQREKSPERHFGSKVYAIKRGFEEIKDLEYDFFCNLDADVSFESNYFEVLLNKFNENPRLGICGGRAIYPSKKGYKIQKYSSESVPGFTQFFRRLCYEQTGGYLAFKYGNEDGYVETKARMLGWETYSFDDIIIFHHRKQGTALGNVFKNTYTSGKIEYYYGFSFHYHFLKCLFSLLEKPIFIGAIIRLLGYIISFIKNEPKISDKEFIKYLRFEHNQKILFKIKKLLIKKIK